MASIKVVLDTRRMKQDRTYPVILRVINNGKSTSVSLGIYLFEKDWDDRKRQVRKSHPNAQLVNHRIIEAYHQLEAKILKADPDSPVTSVTRRNKIVKPIPASPSFFDYGFTWVDRLSKSGKVGNARAYENTLKRMISYLGHNRLRFDDITFDFLEDFQANMLGKGVRQNTISFYLRTVRTIYNKAVKAKLVDRNKYPFIDFSIKNETTAKRAVSKDTIRLIETTELPTGTPIWHYRNYFMLSFYMIGISFVDLSFLKWSDVVDGRVIYKRRKTGKFYSIKLTDKALQVLTHYQSAESKTPYILPIIPSVAIGNLSREMFYTRQGYKYCNINLRRIASGCGITDKFTTYVSRHSWATIAKSLGYSKDLIAEALGHEYGNKVTGIYLNQYADSVIDEVNERVTR
ncbi:MAG: phage integrase SAM-like domain-containing protein [Lewinellaceae bacterium]|nr:site-specific integrase [Saprospiraceae bacterium]MCB9345582.1 phage integrase SAM-like domain-containing protein [Lewinellaceae bacterium]